MRKIFFGWIVAVATLLVNLPYGVFNSFGVFLNPMIGEFGWGRAEASAVFSIYAISYSTCSVAMGILTDRKGPVIAIVAGGVLFGAGIGLSALSTELWHLYVLFGAIAGGGSGAFYVAGFPSVLRWFSNHRGFSLAIGIATLGPSGSSIIIPSVAERMISAFGWRITLATLALSLSVLILVCSLVYRKKPEQYGVAANVRETTESARDWTLREAALTKAFWFIYVVWSLGFFGVTMVRVHLPPQAIDLGISAADAALALGFNGVGIIGGRLFFGWVGSRFSRGKTTSFCFLLQGMTTIMLPYPASIAHLHFTAFLFGLAYGGWLILIPLGLKDLFGIKWFASILAASGTAFGFGGILGPIFAGYVYDVTRAYFVAFLMASLFSIFAGLLFLLVRESAHIGKQV